MWIMVIISVHLLLQLRRCRTGGMCSWQAEWDNGELESNTDYGLLGELKEFCELEGIDQKEEISEDGEMD